MVISSCLCRANKVNMSQGRQSQGITLENVLPFPKVFRSEKVPLALIILCHEYSIVASEKKRMK